jgi:hypothetical protein
MRATIDVQTVIDSSSISRMQRVASTLRFEIAVAAWLTRLHIVTITDDHC